MYVHLSLHSCIIMLTVCDALMDDFYVHRIWFLSKFLRKRAPKYSSNSSDHAGN